MPVAGPIFLNSLVSIVSAPVKV